MARGDDTPSLFDADRGGDGGPAFDPRLVDLGTRLPCALHLGTSSWSFPGWQGLVYGRNTPRGPLSEAWLARSGLEHYARHPLFRSVGIDKTYYRPATHTEYARLAAQVPDTFRFLAKAWRGIVEREPYGGGRAEAFLDPRIAEQEFIRPAVEGLARKAGPLLFQFTPMRFAGERDTLDFLESLRAFLRSLPRGPLYAVEVRNRTLVGPRLGEILADCGAVPCLTVHPTMPDLEIQSRELALDPTKPLVMRWMLRANHRYGEAKDLYAPFDRIVEPDDASRDALARLARAAIDAGLAAWIIVNNKAEGSSPLSVERLARRIAD